MVSINGAVTEEINANSFQQLHPPWTNTVCCLVYICGMLGVFFGGNFASIGCMKK